MASWWSWSNPPLTRLGGVYSAILHLRFPPENHAAVIEYLRTEMGPVIRDNPGFLDFRVLDAGVHGELVMIDTWQRPEDSRAAAERPGAIAVHERYVALGLSVASSARHEVVVALGG